ncbi:MAG: helix-turn-helix domain-containing protein [Lachnospiraceae bacterium]|nr:helix-turn-helix domain-containing protein [Lachnospiraceae bacterium]
MPSFKSGELIKQIRERKKWQQTKLLLASGCTSITLSRIENDHQKPHEETFYLLMNALQMPVEQFLYAYFENQSLDIYLLHDQLINCLDQDEMDQTAQISAEKLIKKLERRKEFDLGINLQFLLRCKAQLYEKQGHKAAVTLSLIDEGMAITFPEFDENDFDGAMLFFEEIELLHTKALIYNREKESQRAVKLLYGIQKGLVKLPKDNYEKEKKLPSILLTLAKLLLQESDFSAALEICELGYSTSLKSSGGRNIPEFLYIKALCLFKLKLDEGYRELLYQAYFGYSILQMGKQAGQVRNDAEKVFGITIETYGVENIIAKQEPVFQPINRGQAIKCKDIGTMIAKLRDSKNLTQQELCQGICHESTLNRIENGSRKANIYQLEALFQRLGRDINLYSNTILSATEFEEKQIKDEIIARLTACQYEEADELLRELEETKSYQSGVNLQFVFDAKAAIIYAQEGYSIRLYNIIIEGIKITRPDFDEQMLEQYYLTYYEILLINMLAIYYCENNNPQGLKIFGRLRKSLNNTYDDELEKIRTYPMILYNYSKYLGLKGRYFESLEIITEGDKLSQKHKLVSVLPGFAINKAAVYFELDKREESIPYFAQAYYCRAMLGEQVNKELIWDYTSKKTGITFLKV